MTLLFNRTVLIKTHKTPRRTVRKTTAEPQKVILQGSDKVRLKAVGGGVAGVAVGLAANKGLTWLHEAAHAGAADTLYHNAQTSIEFTDFGAQMNYSTSGGLTDLGLGVGERGADLAITAAGTAFDLSFAVGAFAAGAMLRKKNRALGTGLMAVGALRGIQSAGYAWSGLSSYSASHDFAHMSGLLGVPPAVIFAGVCSVLPLTWAVVRGLENLTAKKPKANLKAPPAERWEIEGAQTTYSSTNSLLKDHLNGNLKIPDKGVPFVYRSRNDVDLAKEKKKSAMLWGGLVAGGVTAALVAADPTAVFEALAYGQDLGSVLAVTATAAGLLGGTAALMASVKKEDNLMYKVPGQEGVLRVQDGKLATSITTPLTPVLD